VNRFTLRRGWREKVARYRAYGWSLYGFTFRSWAKNCGSAWLKEQRDRAAAGLR